MTHCVDDAGPILCEGGECEDVREECEDEGGV